jgi:hypothetical protein
MQIKINSINDIINLVNTDKLTNEQFKKIVEVGLNCFVLDTMEKDAKIKALIYWRDKILTQRKDIEKPLFFELDINVIDAIHHHTETKKIAAEIETRY